ncbi:PIR Superfamily Protein [Plasmodium ovale wallikeri]|uniref:PIR Superfamily Protein n=1 Tax=Plasmodium ovale wallikeri TaxID=864142 RepID=A0A1A9AF60_PLAOA|nr:PIR Superfamily Protein [Plasmodium ovale wallikeri]SBT56319.1 PIR Superfamily Protein [Plasmodium ovale wallikeri]
MSSALRDIYSFFNDYKTYKSYENVMEQAFSQNKHNTKCDSFLTNIQISDSEKKVSLNDMDFAYLNYWLNDQLRNTTIIHNTTDEDFNNMNLLNELRIKYGEIFANTTTIMGGIIPCIEYFEKCINIYKECIIKCPHDNTSFCNALKNFKEEYDKKIFGLYGISENCPDKKLLKLPTYKDVSLGDNITVVGSILGPCFGTLFTLIFLYKIHAKMGSNKVVHSNLYEENDQLLLNTSDTEYLNFGENTYSISYDSTGNL